LRLLKGLPPTLLLRVLTGADITGTSKLTRR
jgi:hypothetical protein